MTIRSEASGNPLTIQNSSLVSVCTIDTSGNITCGANSVLTTATGYTQAQIDAKVTSNGNLTFSSPISKSGTTVSLDLSAYQPLLSQTTAIIGKTYICY